MENKVNSAIPSVYKIKNSEAKVSNNSIAATLPKENSSLNDEVSFKGNNTNTEKQYKKPGIFATVAGVMTGSIVNNIVNLPRVPLGQMAGNGLDQLSQSVSKDELIKIENSIEETIKTSGLKDKGVSIIKATAENSDEIKQIIGKEANKGILKYLPKGFKKLLGDAQYTQLDFGANAFYTFVSKKILIPEDGLGLAMFHEVGHAMNANLSKIGKMLQNCRGLFLLAMPISLIALFKTKKAPDEKPKNKLDEATTFIKNNAGKLTFMTFLPLLIEEGLASIKGNKIAKQMLTPELARKVAKTNALGFSTYFALAAFSSLGIYLGTKVKDMIAKPKPVDNNK